MVLFANTGNALDKYAKTMDRVGGFRLAQDADVQQKYNKPMSHLFTTKINEAVKAQRVVTSVRLTYDALRQRLCC